MIENAIVLLALLACVCILCYLIHRVKKTEQSVREIKCGEHKFEFVKRHPAFTEFYGKCSQYHEPWYAFKCSCGATKDITEKGLSDEQAVALKALGYKLSDYDNKPVQRKDTD